MVYVHCTEFIFITASATKTGDHCKKVNMYLSIDSRAAAATWLLQRPLVAFAVLKSTWGLCRYALLMKPCRNAFILTYEPELLKDSYFVARWHASPRMKLQVALESHVLADWSSPSIYLYQQQDEKGTAI
jgi:hypothetical protein